MSFFIAKKELTFRSICFSLIISFFFSSVNFVPLSYAANATFLNLPTPGTMVNISEKYTPILVKGIQIFPDDPLKFTFIMDSGDSKLSEKDFQKESEKMAKYFLAALTVPENDLWVNLSPYEKNRIIPEGFGLTEMGRDLLAQDYILKQLTASLVYPEKDFGKNFWDKVYAKAQSLYGTTNIPINTFNKVWILPSKAVVWENEGKAFVVESHLKVMSEEDYLSLQKNMNNTNATAATMAQGEAQKLSKVSADVVKEVLLPAIEKEVNEGKNFANLRQIYNAMILAVWYKNALKESLLGKVYMNQNKVSGVDVADKESKLKIFNQYVEAYKKGVFNYIKEEQDASSSQKMPRKHFSGGASGQELTWMVPGNTLKGPLGQQSGAVRSAVMGSHGKVRAFDWKATDIGPSADLASIALTLKKADAAEVAKIRRGFNVPEGQPKEVFTNTYVSFNLSPVLKNTLEQVPDEVVAAVKASLQASVKQGHLKSFLVHDFQGTDIDVHVTHNFGALNVSVHKDIMQAVRAGLLKAQEMGLLSENIEDNPLSELAKKLNVKTNESTIKERGAESVVISRGINVTSGAVNIKLFNLFAVPGSTPRQKLGLSKAPGVRFLVRRTQDVIAGKNDGPVWDFEISEAHTDAAGKKWPSVNETISLLSLASQPNDYQIVGVYPVEGGALPADEPLATVIYNPIFAKDGKVSMNPTIIFRSQSGADAVGAIGTIMEMPNFVPGGAKGDRYVPTMPVSLEEARKKLPEDKGYFTVYGYQSRNNGQIPSEPIGMLDHVGVNPDAMQVQRELAQEFARIIGDHQWDQPGLTPAAAEHMVHTLLHEQADLFQRAPKEGEEDPVLSSLEDAVQRGDMVTVLDNKADMGGLLGHTAVPPFMSAIYKASMIDATRKGLISNGNTFGSVTKNRLGDKENVGVGDDGHMIMLGDKSRGGLAGNKLAFTAFTRAYLFSDFNEMKPYGQGQDFQGPEAKAAKADPFRYSEFNEEFFQILRELMPLSYMWMVDKVYNGWKDWQGGAKSKTLAEPFSGNVAQQGIGTARYFYDPKQERGFMIVAGDKMGPPALNRPIREAVYDALKAGDFSNGLVFEIWDAKAYDEKGAIALKDLPKTWAEVKTLNIPVAERTFVESAYPDGRDLKSELSAVDKEHLAGVLKQGGFVPAKRIFLDAEQDKEAILRYLADSDRFNIKHVWRKSKVGWDIRNPQEFLDRPVLASSITRLGILTGGEYVGKDDPVMVGHNDLMKHVVEFLRTRPLVIQGDMNGSHWLWSVPTALRYAVATNDSHPIMVALKYSVDDRGKLLTDVLDLTGEAGFQDVRRQAHDFNFRFRQAQLGQFEPLGANSRHVEGSYELAKVLRRLNDPASEFLLSIKQASGVDRQFWPNLPMDQVKEVYGQVDAALVSTLPIKNTSAVHPRREGGINLDPKWMDYQVKRDGKGIPLPLRQQPIGNMQIKGFMEVPVEFKPVNLPAWLGLEKNNPSLQGEQLAQLN